VIEQYLMTVRPMHMEFVEPTKRYADVIIPEGGRNTVALDLVVSRIQALLRSAPEAASLGEVPTNAEQSQREAQP
jgi:uridine kinase